MTPIEYGSHQYFQEKLNSGISTSAKIATINQLCDQARLNFSDKLTKAYDETAGVDRDEVAHDESLLQVAENYIRELRAKLMAQFVNQDAKAFERSQETNQGQSVSALGAVFALATVKDLDGFIDTDPGNLLSLEPGLSDGLMDKYSFDIDDPIARRMAIEQIMQDGVKSQSQTSSTFDQTVSIG